jgi:RimJ/RimL family protein N-acetyltransferase
MQAVLTWADEHLQFLRTACIIDPGNAASLRVASKLGYAEIGRPAYHDQPVVLLHRERQPVDRMSRG